MVRRLAKVDGGNDDAAFSQSSVHYFVGCAIAVGPDATVNIQQRRERAWPFRLVDPDGQAFLILQLFDAYLAAMFRIVCHCRLSGHQALQ